jgi:ABC-type transport system involved in cytochrome bd biosynthesis fused ATPase/permease subunit
MQLHLPSRTLNIFITRLAVSEPDIVHNARVKEMRFLTSVQETGIRFSGGERQRIALARILLQDTPVIILDEPTVGLDAVTERELYNHAASLAEPHA